ncbi:MAG: TRAP transporter substrate-binding protein [Succinivibrio sp.]|nr:TRAP transporter substrate-binding protein [Succinivibrio sp.]
MRYLKAILCGLGMCLTAFAQAAPPTYVMRSAHPYFLSDLHKEITSLQTLELKESTGGRLLIKQYSAPQNNTDADFIKLIKSGKIEGAVVTLTELVEYAPKFNLLLAPYLFDSYEVAYKVLDDYLLAWMNKILEEQDLYVLGTFVFGFRAITTDKLKLEDPEQFAGIKCAVNDVPQFEYAMQALGADAVRYVDDKAFLMDLKQNKIACQESTLAKNRYYKIYKYHHYLVLTHHMLDFRPWVVSRKFYDALPPELKEKFKENVREAQQINRDMLHKSEHEHIASLVKEGMEVVKPRLDPLVKHMKPAYNAINRKAGGNNELFRLLYQIGKIRYGL